MKGQALREAIQQQRGMDMRFIKWWRKENDFVDYELLDPFLQRLDVNQEFSGFELLDMEGMWQTLQRWAGGKASREQRTHGNVIVWHRGGGEGVEELPYTPESVMHIFNYETKGDTVQ